MIAVEKKEFPRALVLLFTLLASIAVICLAFNYTDTPFLYMFAVMIVAINLVAFSVCTGMVRTVLFNGSFALLTLAAI